MMTVSPFSGAVKFAISTFSCLSEEDEELLSSTFISLPHEANTDADMTVHMSRARVFLNFIKISLLEDIVSVKSSKPNPSDCSEIIYL